MYIQMIMMKRIMIIKKIKRNEEIIITNYKNHRNKILKKKTFKLIYKYSWNKIV